MTKSYRLALAGAALIFLFVLGVRTGRQTKAAEGREADKAAIEAVLKAQQAAWNRGDVDAFLVGYWHSPELTFSGSNGVSRGWDGVLARYKKNYPGPSRDGTSGLLGTGVSIPRAGCCAGAGALASATRLKEISEVSSRWSGSEIPRRLEDYS